VKTFIAHLLRRPVGVTAFYILLSAFSVMALVRLPVALLPSLSYPALLIWTSWPEVAPEQVERGLTMPVEQAVAGVQGMKSVTSRSQLGGSLVRLDFGWNTDLDYAALDVRQKLDRLAGFLPDQAERPLVLGVEPSERPILVLALSALDAYRHTPDGPIDLKRLGEDVVARRLEQLDGIARVRVTGGYEREIQVEISPDRMAAYGVSLLQIERALQDANVSLTGGTLQKGPFRYAIEVSGEFRNAEEVAAAVISEQGKPPVRLSEVAAVREGVARRRGLVRFDGREVLLLLVDLRPGANTVRTAAEARQAVDELRPELPGIALDVVVDESAYIEAAIDGVVQSLVWGGLLSVLVLLLFVRRLRLLVAVAVAVPLSLALTLLLFDLLGVTLNLISLSGLALGVGLLVDNSVVVVENIARWREKGLSPYDAAAQGAAEVAGAITTSTLTTLAVFVPLTLVEGLAGRLFRDQSLAVACSVGASLLVALTVVPLIAARDRSNAFVGVGRHSPGLTLYEAVLEHCLARPKRVVVGTLAFLIVTVFLAFGLEREVVPEADEGRVEVQLTLPPDVDLSLMSARSAGVETALSDLPGVEHVLADLGERDDARLDIEPRPPYVGDLTVVMAPGAESQGVLQQLSGQPAAPDLKVEARPVKTQLEALLVSGESDLVIDLVAEQRAEAEAAVPTLLTALSKRPELANVSRSDPEGVPAYDLQFDRDALVRLGAQPEVLDSYLEATARGREATQLNRMREQIPVVLRAAAGSVEELLAERVPTEAGMLPLGTFVRAEPVRLPAVLQRHGQAPVVRLLVDLAPGVGLAQGIVAVRSAVEVALPAGVRNRIGGANQAFRESLGAVGWSLLLSVVLMYLILATQFESLRQPLIVLSMLPLALGGAALALAITGQSWNLMSLTACVMLVGIADNDAILKVNFVNRRRQEGLSLKEAIRQAGHDRFRPIVMAMVTTVMGLLPLSLGWGAGGSLQAPLAVAIVGGLLVATGMTLVVVPVVIDKGSAFRRPIWFRQPEIVGEQKPVQEQKSRH
jgi:HAE1 family hydrophobic/amphiphilic exporter-1